MQSKKKLDESDGAKADGKDNAGMDGAATKVQAAMRGKSGRNLAGDKKSAAEADAAAKAGADGENAFAKCFASLTGAIPCIKTA